MSSLLQPRPGPTQPWTYEDWRATVPWTTAQIADGIRKASELCQRPYKRQTMQSWAEHIERTNRVSSHAVVTALPFLVLTCHFCARKALFRFGFFGACRAHRDHLVSANLARVAYIDARRSAFEKDLTEKDRARLAAEKHHAARGRR